VNATRIKLAKPTLAVESTLTTAYY